MLFYRILKADSNNMNKYTECMHFILISILMFLNIFSISMRIFKHTNPEFKTKILDFTYTSEPSINSALPLKINTAKMILFLVGCLLTSGFLWLIAKWSPKKKAILLYDVCEIGQATSFLIEEEDVVGGSLIVERTNVNDVKRKTFCVSFRYHERVYLYHEQKQVFLPIRYEELGQQLDKLKKGKYQPYSNRMRHKLLEYYGRNTIDLPVQSKLEVFIQEMLTPYQVFQLYAIILWIYEEYYIFAFLLFGYSLYCYWTYSQQAVSNQQKLREQSYFDISCKIAVRPKKEPYEEHNDSEQLSILDEPINFDEDRQQKSPNSNNKMKTDEKLINFNEQIDEQVPKPLQQVEIKSVRKNNLSGLQLEFQEKSSLEILPGDIIILEQGDTIPCDCIIIHGEALLNEKYISGEEYLIRKREIQKFTYQKQKQKSFLLYLGTSLTKVKGKAGQWQVNTSQMDTGRITNHQFPYSMNQSMRDHNDHNKMDQSKFENIDFSEVLQSNEIACLVTQTNYNTQRGKYLRAVRYQKKPVLNFTKETIIFLYIIIAITVIGYLIILPRIKQEQSSWNLFIILLDLAGDSIPMTLPAILSMGISFAQHRLSKHGISSVLPSNILAGGLADTLILDSQQIFGKKLSTSSITIGHRQTGHLGKTYSSLQQFLEFNSMSSLSESFQNNPHIKAQQNQYEEERGKMMLKAFALCHMLEYYNEKMCGSEQEKSLFDFCEGKYVKEDCFEVLGEVHQITQRIYFREKDNKFAVVAKILDSSQLVLGRRTSNKSYHEINTSQINSSTLEKRRSEQEQPKKKQELELLDGEQSKILNHSTMKNKMILIKGPPQKIIKVCKKDSCPHEIEDYVVDMAEKGFILVAYAYKWIGEDFNSDRDFEMIRKDFVFSGFASLEKQKQEDTIKTIESLKKAHLKMLLISEKRELEATSQAIRNSLCTKNELLLCSLHRDKIFCKGHIQWQSSAQPNHFVQQFLQESRSLIKHSKVSLTSRLYETLYMRREETHDLEELFTKLLIFNQMENKHSRNLYFQLEKKGFVTFAVGNGSSVSECAHLSLELDRGQCSLVSSFHTQQKSLSCITQCLIICRAALATNFHAFSMMVHFSLIQFTTVLILEYHYQAITDSQMLYEDLFVTFPIFITINMTRPASKLSKQLPPKSFFSLRPLLSTIGQLLIQFVVQMAFIEYLLSMEIFVKELQVSKEYYLQNHDFKDTEVSLALFIITNYLYLGIVLSTSVSEPFRRPFYTNVYYTVTLCILWAYNTIIVMAPSLAPGSIRKQQLSEETEQILVIAMLLGNLVMVCMYMFEKLLQWIWNCWWGHQRNMQIQRSGMVEQN